MGILQGRRRPDGVDGSSTDVRLDRWLTSDRERVLDRDVSPCCPDCAFRPEYLSA